MDGDVATRERGAESPGDLIRMANDMMVMLLKMVGEQYATMESILTHFSWEDASAVATRVIGVRKRLVEEMEHAVRAARRFSAQSEAFAAHGYASTSGVAIHHHDGELGAPIEVTMTQVTSAIAVLRVMTDTVINTSTARLTAIDSFIAQTLKADLDRVVLASRAASTEDDLDSDADQLHLPE